MSSTSTQSTSTHKHDDGVTEHTSLLGPATADNGKARAGPASASYRTMSPNSPKPSPTPHTTSTPQPDPSSPTTSPQHIESTPTLWSRLRTSYISSLILENKGSVARDHLAVERTFLAYIRTSLTFASLGIGITQLYRLNLPVRGTQSPASTLASTTQSLAQASAATTLTDSGTSASLPSAASPSGPATPYYDAIDPITRTVARSATALGLVFLGIAILILLSAWRRYFEVQRYVIRNQFPASRGLVLGVVFFTGAIIMGCAGVVIAVGAGS